MAILVDDGTRLLVQGITGREGAFHTARMLQSGTRVVAGVTPGKGGQDYEDVPVFDTVEEAVEETGANASIIFVPPPFAADAIFESLDAGLSTICCITEGIPVHDMMRVANYLGTKDATLVGPNCPGVLSPEKANVSIMPKDIFMPGNVGVVSRSGTLTYQIVNELTQREIGQSTAVGIGGDPIIGTDFIEILSKFEADPETECAVMIGEIGGKCGTARGGVRQKRDEHPRRSLHRGLYGPGGQDHGTCWRHRLWRREHGRGQKRGAEGGGHKGSDESIRGSPASRRDVGPGLKHREILRTNEVLSP